MSTPPAPQHTPTKISKPQESGRRSKQARQRVDQMKRMYGLLSETTVTIILHNMRNMYTVCLLFLLCICSLFNGPQ